MGSSQIQVHQDLIIDRLNEEFKKQKFSSQVLLNEGGVCHGLSMVYAMYALQGPEKEQEFVKNLERIASGQLNNGELTESEIGELYLFATQIQLAFNPIPFVPSLTQTTSMGMVKINNKPLTSSFDFALAASDEKWGEVLQKIDLKNDEVMMVLGANHTVAIHKEGAQYKIYDPNYRNGFELFNSELEVMQALHKDVFGYSQGNLGLRVHVIRHPEHENIPRDFPDVTQLYKEYAFEQNPKATLGELTFDTWNEAVRAIQDPNIIQDLFADITPEDALKLAKFAVLFNNKSSLKALLTRVIPVEDYTDTLAVVTLFRTSLRFGKLEVFNELDKHFLSWCKDRDLQVFIKDVVQGGNSQLLEKILEKEEEYRKNLQLEILQDEDFISKDENSQKEMLAEKQSADYREDSPFGRKLSSDIRTSISTLIESKLDWVSAKECIAVLMNEAEKRKYLFTEEQKIHYLLAAIQHNQDYIVEYLIREKPGISKELLQSISMTDLAVQRTNAGILTCLKKEGMQFSPNSEELIRIKHSKEEQTPSILTRVSLFINYLQELFQKKPQITYEPPKKKEEPTRRLAGSSEEDPRCIESFHKHKNKHKEGRKETSEPLDDSKSHEGLGM